MHSLKTLLSGKKSQVSTEYIIIIALALAVIIPGAVIIYNYSQGSSDEVVSRQVSVIGKDIMFGVENVYYSGKHSMTTIETSLPNNVKLVYLLKDYEIVIVFTAKNGEREAVFFSDIPLKVADAGSCDENDKCIITTSTGALSIRATSMGDYIILERVT